MARGKRPNLWKGKGKKKTKKDDPATKGPDEPSTGPHPLVSVVRGSRHQGDHRYVQLSRNHQCTANAVVALAYNKVWGCEDWSSDTIDSVLDYGDYLYRKSLTSRAVPFGDFSSNRDLMVIEVHPKFIIRNTAFTLTLDETLSVNGRVGVETEGPYYTLGHGLEHIFGTFDSVVFTAGNLSVAVFKFDTAYFIFDSHSRNEKGMHTDTDGTACLLKFNAFSNLRDYMINFHQADAAYSLFPVIVQHERSDGVVIGVYEVLCPISDTVFSVPSQTISEVPVETEATTEATTPPSTSRPPISRTEKRKAAIGQAEPECYYLGQMDVECSHCRALFFNSENKTCCNKGAIRLPTNNRYPELLHDLVTNVHPQSANFLKNIRRYNTLLAFGSTKATLRTGLDHGAPVIVISGQIYHSVANIDPANPHFGSMYFIDAGEASEQRRSNSLFGPCNENLLQQLDALLRTLNPFAEMYRTLGQVVRDEIATRGENNISRMGLYFHTKPGTDRRIHAAPANANEIGAVFRSHDGEVPPPGQIRIFYKEAGWVNIPKLSPFGDALCYPLMFPYGDLGWSVDLGREIAGGRKRISKREFDNFRLMVRAEHLNPILNCGRLTQQYIVDKYVELEGDRLNYQRLHQVKLRAENYAGLQDYVSRNVANESSSDGKIGRVVVLPSTFTGGPRFMQQSYQDAMAIVCKFGRPSLFITFTCNPQWKEIKDNLRNSLFNPQDRPELIARVFEQKRKAFFEDVLKKKIFGTVQAYVYVIEFQKRGLPHMHCLLTLADEDKLRDPEDVDKFICAELPETNSRLFGIVMASLIHGPCGERNLSSPCMEDGRCSKRYPKPYSRHTNIDMGKRPVYRRRNDGRFAELTTRSGVVHVVDNRDVVPHNPYLCLKYDCHINVEVCSNVISCKYIFKYINKGPDSVVVRANNEVVLDEIAAYLDSRYVSAGEAAWRLLEFHMQGKSHSIFRLPVHLPGERIVYFVEGHEDAALLQNEDKCSILEAYFRLNIEDPEARRYGYTEIPIHYSYNTSQHRWIKRKIKWNVIPRMYTISPKYVEKFHLRILLLHVHGAQSFEDLRTVNGILCNTFQEAARIRLLVSSDDEWKRTLDHAAQVDMPGSMRKLFAYMLCFCEIGDPLALWESYKEYMIEDFARTGLSAENSENRALQRIRHYLSYLGRTLQDFHLPQCIADDADDVVDANEDDRVQDAVQYDPRTLNTEQRCIFERIINVVESDGVEQRCFYLQGSGGTGKTFLYNTILTELSSKQIPSVAVAFTGIAALLLINGRTVHSAFRLPLTMNADSRSSITAQSEEGIALRNIRLIVWDEVSMASYYVVDAVDRLLQDVCNNHRPFGGKCVLFGGDVKQLLPVAPGRVQQIELFFTNCQSWKYFKVLQLTVNMRTDADEQEFAQWLLKLGTGTINETRHNLPEDSVRLPDQCVTQNVVEEIYGDMNFIGTEDASSLASKAILCPKNEHCNALNDKILAAFPGEEIVIRSVDSVVSDNEEELANFTEEYLNSIVPSGLPLHKLKLKVGVPIILLRNLSLKDGLINGTRLLVLAVTEFLLTAEIVTGSFTGQKVLIPRMDLTSSDKNFPFVLKRRQFPVKLCFALTINKAQGQTFDKVGIYLGCPIFAHGQLYVAFSRARRWDGVKIEVPKSRNQGKLLKFSPSVFTKNIVYRNIIRSILDGTVQ